jgi:hypothetical protein
MSTDIPFIVDVLQSSDKVEVQVNILACYFSF